jgi:large subunit ribosomal protein L6
MSRLIKKPITIPAGVTVALNGDILSVKGSKGDLTVSITDGVIVKVDGTELWISEGTGLAEKAMLGTTWALAKNAVLGVTEGFTKTLEIEGVGYRAEMKGKDLTLHLGYALPVPFAVESGVTVAVEKNSIKISGINKEMVGRVAAEIRALKKPEPYKGKGIHYKGEVIRRKAGKKAGTAAG